MQTVEAMRIAALRCFFVHFMLKGGEILLQINKIMVIELVVPQDVKYRPVCQKFAEPVFQHHPGLHITGEK